jgi:hypothetical protein
MHAPPPENRHEKLPFSLAMTLALAIAPATAQHLRQPTTPNWQRERAPTNAACAATCWRCERPGRSGFRFCR